MREIKNETPNLVLPKCCEETMKLVWFEDGTPLGILYFECMECGEEIGFSIQTSMRVIGDKEYEEKLRSERTKVKE